MTYVDPVCGMEIDPSRSPHRTLYKGKVYYFCSKQCLKLFEKDPEYYLKRGPTGMSH